MNTTTSNHRRSRWTLRFTAAATLSVAALGASALTAQPALAGMEKYEIQIQLQEFNSAEATAGSAAGVPDLADGNSSAEPAMILCPKGHENPDG